MFLTHQERATLKGWLEFAERAEGAFDETWIQEAFQRLRLNAKQQLVARLALAGILKLWSVKQ